MFNFFFSGEENLSIIAEKNLSEQRLGNQRTAGNRSYVCAWGRGGVESKPDFVKWLEMNPVCAWHVGEGTVQT